MSDDKREIKFAGTIAPDQVAQYLERLAAGLRAGAVTVDAGGEALTMRLNGPISLAVKAKVKKQARALELELRWEHDASATLLIGPGA